MRYEGNQARARQLWKRDTTLSWIRKFIYSDRRTIALLLDVSKSVAADLIAEFRREGLLARTIGHNVACPVFRLTPAGARAIENYRGEYDHGLRAITGADDAGVYLAGHNLMAQRVTAKLWAKSGYRGVILSPRQIRLHGLEIGTASEAKHAWKVPDALLIRPATETERDALETIEIRTAFEIQQSDEAAETRAHKLWQYHAALTAQQIHNFLYCSSLPLINAYREQWMNNLEERTYEADRHRWRQPVNPQRIAPGSPILKRGDFEQVKHDPYAIGLYPDPDLLDTCDEDDE